MLTAPLAILLVPVLAMIACSQTTSTPPAGTSHCDNRPHDARALNAAIQASAEGAEIVISGTCLLTEPVKLLGLRTYRGSVGAAPYSARPTVPTFPCSSPRTPTWTTPLAPGCR